IAMNQAFFWNPGGFSLLKNSYLYYVLACFLPIVFLAFPAAKRLKDKRLPLYDVALAAVTLLVCAYLGFNGENIVNFGWDYAAPTAALVASFVLWAHTLEALRRTSGLVVTIIALAFSLFPLTAGDIPIGFLRGIPFDLTTAGQIHSLGTDSIMGLPL